MECKAVFSTISGGERLRIKVEPYWNVKIDALMETKKKREIKVEPYWNVKRIEAFMEAVESELK